MLPSRKGNFTLNHRCGAFDLKAEHVKTTAIIAHIIRHMLYSKSLCPAEKARWQSDVLKFEGGLKAALKRSC